MTSITVLRMVARSTFLVLLLATGTGWMGGAMANGSGCHSIKDWDARHQCLAETKSNYSYCYSVRDHDGRKLCLATIKQQRGYCHSIKAEDRRKRCLAAVR